MPEGHSVHRIAKQFSANFTEKQVHVTSPQGRFAEGAALISDQTLELSRAVGKQMFLRFSNGRWLRVHLGLYGAWDFWGEISIDPTIAASNGRMGQTNQRGTIVDVDGENSLSSIGAPRLSRGRVRMSEDARVLDDSRQGIDPDSDEWPPPVIGQVRARLLTGQTCADLRGPTACAVQSGDEIQAVIDRLGPDPLVDDPDSGEERFVANVRRRRVAIGQLLMDQSVVSGIGNVYRAELLFRARMNPHLAGNAVTTDQARALWRDWSVLLRIGVQTGQMMTMDGLSEEEFRYAMANRDDRHWVYHRAGLPCRVCGTEVVLEEMQARKLYWCPQCQR